MFSFLTKICFLDIYPKKQLKLSDFQEFRFIIDDTHNDVPNGKIWLCYFDKVAQFEEIIQITNMNENLIKNRDDIEKIAHKSIGYVSYKIMTGQIELFFIKKEYQNSGLGKQILTNVIDELLIYNNDIWAITSQNHPFWSNVYEESFQFTNIPHNSVTKSGYLLNLNKYNKYKEEYDL